MVHRAQAQHRPGGRGDVRQLSADLLAEAPGLIEPGLSPAHVQIEHWLTGLISNARLRAGDKIPSEKQMAGALGVSRMTLRQALSSLEARGVVERIPGRHGGTFIVEPKTDADITGLAGFTAQLRQGHVRASARVIAATTTAAAPDVARALRLELGAAVHDVVRVRTAHRQPLALERSYLPAALFPDLLEHSLRGSLYTLLRRRYDQVPYSAREYLDAILADSEHARLLRVPEGSALLRLERTAFTVTGQPVEHACDLLRPDRIRLVIRTAANAASALRRLLPTEP